MIFSKYTEKALQNFGGKIIEYVCQQFVKNEEKPCSKCLKPRPFQNPKPNFCVPDPSLCSVLQYTNRHDRIRMTAISFHVILFFFPVISRGSSPGFISPADSASHYSRVVNKSNSSSLIKEDMAMSDAEEASLTWLEKQQRKLEERRSAQRRRELSGGSHFGGGHVGGGGGAGGHEANLMRELKTSLDRARSETTDGYAASETASLLFSDTSTRESSPHKPIHMEMNGGGGGHGHSGAGGFKTSTPKSNTIAGSTAASSGLSLSRNMSDSSYDRSRPLIQRRLRYDSEGEQSNGVASSVDSLASRPITPGFPNVPQTPVFGQPPPTSNG